jgi:spoIIIJ-associated protein
MSTEPAAGPKPSPDRPGRMDREAVVAELRRYLDTIVRAGRFNLRYQIQLQEPAAAGPGNDRAEIVAQLDGPDRDLLLERGAELLQALEHIAVRWLRLDRELHDRVQLDCGNYHADRLAELKLSAQVAAERVRETRAPFRFNPMTASDRRIIHLALQGQAGVRTASEGVGEQRRLVVLPADAKK